MSALPGPRWGPYSPSGRPEGLPGSAGDSLGRGSRPDSPGRRKAPERNRSSSCCDTAARGKVFAALAPAGPGWSRPGRAHWSPVPPPWGTAVSGPPGERPRSHRASGPRWRRQRRQCPAAPTAPGAQSRNRPRCPPGTPRPGSFPAGRGRAAGPSPACPPSGDCPWGQRPDPGPRPPAAGAAGTERFEQRFCAKRETPFLYSASSTVAAAASKSATSRFQPSKAGSNRLSFIRPVSARYSPR